MCQGMYGSMGTDLKEVPDKGTGTSANTRVAAGLRPGPCGNDQGQSSNIRRVLGSI